MEQNILIIGGYGAVGSQIASYLAPLYPHRIIIAGRDFDKARKKAQELTYDVIPQAFDLNHFQDESILDNVKLVIVCLDSNDTRLVEACIRRRIIYLDISARYETLKQIEALENLALFHKSTVILSAGLAPGLTNLLAQQAYNELPLTRSIDIFILLGLGEKHGEQAYRWTFNHIDHHYKVGNVPIKSFTLPLKTDLSGLRNFYTFDFSDQHVLSTLLPNVIVRTRMSFDLNWFTKLTALLRKLGFTRIFRNEKVQNIAINAFNNYSIGTDLFGAKVIARNQNKETKEYTFIGNNEGKVTAAFTTEVALLLLTTANLPYGVLHSQTLIHDIFRFIEKVQSYDNSFRFSKH
ncbi:saccharopine dehydrogenase NADP-binding domain-containing protein [Sphingobacterium tabacisoli]|uniref:Saccharopine dehydrogenase NADP-binding domain-containing protein n=1 Tax=Sphingobacterium tabacisoli TaxID=2044855 RepID=A0ABW5LA89_9SPHI|nr:saccharopine dehydrogenase NADP-binding domain-containing protein [Sphingobacterium tabacisoli]